MYCVKNKYLITKSWNTYFKGLKISPFPPILKIKISKTISLFLKYAAENKDRMYSNWGPDKFNRSFLSLSLLPLSLRPGYHYVVMLMLQASTTDSGGPVWDSCVSHSLCLENSWVHLWHWHEMSQCRRKGCVLSGLEFDFSWVCNDLTMLCKRTPRVLVRQFSTTANEHYSSLLREQNMAIWSRKVIRSPHRTV